MGYKTGFPRYLVDSSSFHFRTFRSLDKYNIFISSSVYWHLVPQATDVIMKFKLQLPLLGADLRIYAPSHLPSMTFQASFYLSRGNILVLFSI